MSNGKLISLKIFNYRGVSYCEFNLEQHINVVKTNTEATKYETIFYLLNIWAEHTDTSADEKIRGIYQLLHEPATIIYSVNIKGEVFNVKLDLSNEGIVNETVRSSSFISLGTKVSNYVSRVPEELRNVFSELCVVNFIDKDFDTGPVLRETITQCYRICSIMSDQLFNRYYTKMLDSFNKAFNVHGVKSNIVDFRLEFSTAGSPMEEVSIVDFDHELINQLVFINYLLLASYSNSFIVVSDLHCVNSDFVRQMVRMLDADDTMALIFTGPSHEDFANSYWHSHLEL